MVAQPEQHRETSSLRIVRNAQVRTKLDVSEAKLFDMIAKGLFPAPFQIVPGGRAVGWLESDVDQWILERKASIRGRFQMTAITPITRAVAKAEADKYPTLTGNGFNYARFASEGYTDESQRQDREDLWSDDGLTQIAYAFNYAKENRISPKVNSYGVKHAIERWSDDFGEHQYISNGCAILGLSLAGYEVLISEGYPNCYFRVRRQA